MNLKIGNQTAFAAGSPLEPFEFAMRHGFSAFEFFPDRGPAGNGGWDERGMSLAEREYIRRAAETCGITLTVHAPLAFDPLRAPDDARLETTVEFALDIGAVLVNLHLDMSQGAEAFGAALRPALDATHKAKLKLCLENSVWTGPQEFNEFFQWMAATHRSRTRHMAMCFDLGHANVCAATRNDYCGFLDQLDLGLPIAHLHLHENFGDRDSHLPLFTGPSGDNPDGILGVLQRLQARRFSGCCILEQWPQPPALLAEARDRLQLLQNVAGQRSVPVC
jgi:sugar phosphate isomerase/epimerase